MKHFYYMCLILLFSAAGSASAKTWTIQFGGSIGFAYSPSSIPNVQVGDVIMWQPNSTAEGFSFHPLASTSVPSGAMSFSNSSGPSFSYTVTVPGDYAYECTVHGTSFNMKGTFHVAAAGVETAPDTKMMMDPIYPNPASMESMVHFNLASAGHVTLRVFDATGKLAMTPVDEEMDAGFHMVTLDTKQLGSGTYHYVLQEGDAVLRREMIVVK